MLLNIRLKIKIIIIKYILCEKLARALALCYPLLSNGEYIYKAYIVYIAVHLIRFY